MILSRGAAQLPTDRQGGRLMTGLQR